MRIAMFTNTYLPHVGGVARSIESISQALRKDGHQVLIIAPSFPDLPEEETDVIRVPAMERFNGSDFSVYLPNPGFLDEPLQTFKPDLIHSHHPFLLGDTALRMASSLNIPLLFTHHTMYEQYTHYLADDSALLKSFVIELTSGYANQCWHIIAPSTAVMSIIRHRGVTQPITVLPTGIVMDHFASADGTIFRLQHSIPLEAFVAGHTGRLAEEKNLLFLGTVIAQFLKGAPERHFILVGVGPLEVELKKIFELAEVTLQVHWAGILQGEDLANAYAAMNIFVFASRSETQGMVLAESMAAGTPVIALQASGVNDIVIDQVNGFLLIEDNLEKFVQALVNFENLSLEEREKFRFASLKTAQKFSMSVCIENLTLLYASILREKSFAPTIIESSWASTTQRLQAEWKIWANFFHATGAAIFDFSETHL